MRRNDEIATKYEIWCESISQDRVGSKQWFCHRVNEIYEKMIIPYAQENPIPVDETELMQTVIWWEVFSVKQCADNYYYLTGKSLYQVLPKILTNKNRDYSWDENAFDNLELCESIWIEAVTGIKVRMCDKVSRIRNLVNKEPAVAGESLADTWLDLAWYLTLLYLYEEYVSNKWLQNPQTNQN